MASHITAVAVHAVGRGHGGVVELSKRRPLHEGAEDVGAVDDAGRLDTGESSDGCECVQGSLLNGAAGEAWLAGRHEPG